MTGHLRVAMGLVAAAAMTLSLPASAQECGIRRVGGANRFVDSVDTEAELQSVFKDKWSEIEALLKEAGWSGDPKDLAAAVADGAATEKSFAKGTHFEWMMLRRGGKPGLLRDDCWGGDEPLPGYAIDVESKGRRSHFAVPKACGNVALISSEAIAQPPAPPPPPRPAPPPPAPAPPAPAPPPPAAAPPPPPRAPAPPPAAAPPVAAPEETVAADRPHWMFELFAGYFFPEELDEDLTYGLRFGRRGLHHWGWMIAGSWFDVADSQGFSGFDVDADVVHVDFQAQYYPREDGNFSIFFGPGWASGNVDVPGSTEDLSDDVFSAHVGLGYEIDVARNFYIKPDARLRWYELEGFGPDGGKDNQLTYEAAIALGWRLGRR